LKRRHFGASRPQSVPSAPCPAARNEGFRGVQAVNIGRGVALTLGLIVACVSGFGACASGELPPDASSQPCPSQPCPSQPCPSQPCPSQPCPSQPCPSQPVLLDGVSLDGVSLGTMTAPLAAADAEAASSAPPDAGASPDAGAAGGNDCCTASGSGGCDDDTVEACVCAGDPFCCEVEYDALCARQAVSRCGLDCDDRSPVSDCCGPSDVPGCTQPEVEACICNIDPFCCVFRFDQSCVNLGIARCGAACASDPGGRDESTGETAEEVQP
jgi:hypothetical protein